MKKDYYKKAIKRLQLHTQGVERVRNEIDIVDFVSEQRLSRFNMQLNLKNYQRYFVNRFNSYNIDCVQEKNEF